ncbi:MAG: histidine kinase [Roseivirga sp.]|nr:histidine kinase [Roseivirga sp.]
MKIKEVHVRWIGIPVLATIMSFVMGREQGETLGQKLVVSLFFTTMFWNGAFLMFMYFRRRYPLIPQTPKRLLITALSLITFLIVGDFGGCLALGVKSWDEITQPAVVFSHTLRNVTAATIVGILYECVYFFEQWKQTIHVNEALKNQQIRTQFEVLQNQMSPHFLFNSLNTLTALIPEDSDIAVEFTQKLSEVYRYILQNKERELVTVEEELNFAKAYVFLLKMRYPENLNVNFEVEEKHRRQYIAPLTLQMLIENAIKHNVVSKMNPLSIEVYVDNGKSIVVKNNLQKKNVIDKSTKTGLANIQKRYELLGNKVIDIMTTAKNFIVAVPLIDVVHQREYELITK